eukprot:768673-Hanusia_phi.AAC.3
MRGNEIQRCSCTRKHSTLGTRSRTLQTRGAGPRRGTGPGGTAWAMKREALVTCLVSCLQSRPILQARRSCTSARHARDKGRKAQTGYRMLPLLRSSSGCSWAPGSSTRPLGFVWCLCEQRELGTGKGVGKRVAERRGRERDKRVEQEKGGRERRRGSTSHTVFRLIAFHGGEEVLPVPSSDSKQLPSARDNGRLFTR